MYYTFLYGFGTKYSYQIFKIPQQNKKKCKINKLIKIFLNSWESSKV